ncbi:hypothetical protein AC249_AIPGENE16553, partial [Exaiptasia diaphana]
VIVYNVIIIFEVIADDTNIQSVYGVEQARTFVKSERKSSTEERTESTKERATSRES